MKKILNFILKPLFDLGILQKLAPTGYLHETNAFIGEKEKTMIERVITTTIQITKVYRDVPECFENDKTQYGESMKNRVKDATDADNVVVLNVHEVKLQGLRDQMDDEFIGGNDE